jgi:hypothetical protein
MPNAHLGPIERANCAIDTVEIGHILRCETLDDFSDNPLGLRLLALQYWRMRSHGREVNDGWVSFRRRLAR